MGEGHVLERPFDNKAIKFLSFVFVLFTHSGRVSLLLCLCVQDSSSKHSLSQVTI